MRKTALVSFALLLSFAIIACGDDASDPVEDAGDEPKDERAAFTLLFLPSFGDVPADCESWHTGFGPEGDQAARLEELRFYIHGVEFIDGEGERVPAEIIDEAPWQNSGVAYLHFANPGEGCLSGEARRDKVSVRAREGDYEGIVFRLGVPKELNHLDPALAASPLNIGPMSWGWMMGYLYFRAELAVDVEDEPTQNFAVHVGSMACEGSLVPEPDIHCEYPNLPTIALPSFRPEQDTILVDLAALVGATDLRPEGEAHHGSAGCMAEIDPAGEGYEECIEPMTSLGIDYGAHPASMDAFRVAN